MLTLITSNEIACILPELVLLFSACAVLVLHLFIGQDKERVVHFCYTLSQGGIILSLIAALFTYDSASQLIFNNHYIFDNLTVFLKISMLFVALFVFMYSKDYLLKRHIQSGEYYALALFSVLGMMLLVSAHSMLMIYIGLELLSLPLYALVALQRDIPRTPEAAMKYFVLGALSSGMLLYGISLIYGMSHSLDHAEIARYLSGDLSSAEMMVVSLGMVFILVAVAFKLGIAPFHMWVPDIYDGAPASVTLFIATLPKMAALGMVLRLLPEALGSLHVQWQPMVLFMSMISIVIGNVIAIAQTNIKRVFAYSAIAHMGFMMLGVLAGDESGYSASLFYGVTYALSSAGAFGILILLSRTTFETESIDDLRGLNIRNPWCALVMMIVIFSMAGIPPAVGFYAKLAVLQAIVNKGYVGAATIAVISSVVGGFYYLRMVKYMYFDNPEDPVGVRINSGMKFGLSLNGLLIVGLGLFPSFLFFYCTRVFFM